MTPRETHPGRALTARLVLLVLVVGGSGALLGGLFLPTAFAVTDMVDSVRNDVLNVPPMTDEFVAPPENSVIFAADGSELETIYFEENRDSVPLSRIPPVVRNAVVATEDAEFWEHRGVNYRALVRAGIANLRAGGIEQGGSTITQQYVKNVVLTTDRTLDRKITEALYAVELERRLTKEEILERYLNRTYFGNGIYGIGTAAHYYFGKDVADLRLEEAALLAGVIRAPERNNPITSPDNARNRRNVVLEQMAHEGMIAREQAQEARARPVELDIHPLEEPDSPFFADWVKRLLVNELTAQALGTHADVLDLLGETREERRATVFQGGLRIHTTLDPELQQFAETTVAEFLPDPLRNPLGALVSVVPETGAIVAMAIGPKQHGECSEPVETAGDGKLLCDKTKFNPVVPADAGSERRGRQPGSSFKPYVTAAALESGIPPGWQINASGPQTIPGCDAGNDWTVRNAGGDGLRDLYTGVAGSSNVFHARLIAEIGPEKVADMAYRLGIRRSPLPAECSLALGAIEVFPIEMASAFGTFANRGVYCPPFAITRIEDKHGRLLYEHSPDCERIVDVSIADRVVDILAGPVSAGGTAPVANLGRWPTRGKTGTTNDYVDAWFVGFVKQLSTAAWIGFENGLVHYEDGTSRVEKQFLTNVTIGERTYARVFGGTIPAPMWKHYMEQAVQRFEPEGWPAPGPMQAATVPDVTQAANIAEAKAILEGAGLNMAVVEIPHFSPPGTILGQNPEAGGTVPAGRLVSVHVSDGEAPVPTVPDVVGMEREEAIRVLHEAGYDVEVATRNTSDRDEDGIVFDQSPEAGDELAPGDGARVVIQVGRFRGPDPSPSPSEDVEEEEDDDEEGGNGGGGGGGGGGGRPGPLS